MVENLKFSNIVDYWDEEIVGKITKLLHEFKDLFLTKFSEIKGLVGYLGEMKITLRPDSKLVKQRPYRLNLSYKEKVKEKLDQILEAGVIELVEES